MNHYPVKEIGFCQELHMLLPKPKPVPSSLVRLANNVLTFMVIIFLLFVYSFITKACIPIVQFCLFKFFLKKIHLKKNLFESFGFSLSFFLLSFAIYLLKKPDCLCYAVLAIWTLLLVAVLYLEENEIHFNALSLRYYLQDILYLFEGSFILIRQVLNPDFKVLLKPFF